MDLAAPSPSAYGQLSAATFDAGSVGKETHLPAIGCVCFSPLAGEAAMMEERSIIQMNIDRYRAMLGLLLSNENRARIEQLLAEATSQLALAGDVKNP